ncbi:hypothetical protein PENTCL1PPCAC_24762, partial [Pristionchus entomophagus]
SLDALIYHNGGSMIPTEYPWDFRTTHKHSHHSNISFLRCPENASFAANIRPVHLTTILPIESTMYLDNNYGRYTVEEQDDGNYTLFIKVHVGLGVFVLITCFSMIVE